MEQAVGTRIAALRKRMAERGMDAYLIPTADFHGSEYVDGYFKARQFITGFTGSAGTAVIRKPVCGQTAATSCRRLRSLPQVK